MSELTNQFLEIESLINQAKNAALKAVNHQLIHLYWNVGKYVSDKLKSAEWGDKVVVQLADFLKKNQPDLKGFEKRSIYRMVQFYQIYSSDEIVSTASAQLGKSSKNNPISMPEFLFNISWSHHIDIMSGCKTSEEKLFYIILSYKEKLSVKELRRQIKSCVFERTMLSNEKLSSVIKELPQDTTNVFRDSYILEFLQLPEIHSEQTLRKSLLKNLKEFMMELGRDFLFVGEEFKVQVGMQDFFIDLVFYHRDLQCLVAFELKTEKFSPSHLGQINFYLEALDRDIRKPHENPSIGILLCNGKDDTVVEYALSRSLSPALIADYQTKLPDKKLLQEKWQQLIELSEI